MTRIYDTFIVTADYPESPDLWATSQGDKWGPLMTNLGTAGYELVSFVPFSATPNGLLRYVAVVGKNAG